MKSRSEKDKMRIFLYAIALVMMIALTVFMDYAWKHDFDYAFKKWFINIHIKSE